MYALYFSLALSPSLLQEMRKIAFSLLASHSHVNSVLVRMNQPQAQERGIEIEQDTYSWGQDSIDSKIDDY